MQVREINKLSSNGKYRIRKFSPMVGSYVMPKVMSKLFPGMMENQVGFSRSTQPTKEMTFTEHQELMGFCFEVCSVMPNGQIIQEIPLLNENKSFSIQDFGHEDAVLLSMEVLAFNSEGFFTPEFAKQVQTILKGFMDNVQNAAEKLEPTS